MSGKAFHGLCAAVLVTATAVIAQPPVTSSRVSQGDANKQICRTMADTGSRLAQTRACHTAQEWADIDAGKRAPDVISHENQLGTASRRDNSLPDGPAPF